MGTDAMDTLGENVRLVGAEKLHQAARRKQRCRKIERVKNNLLQMTKTQLKSQREKFRISWKKGTVGKYLKYKERAQNCSVERGEARESTNMAQSKSE